MRGALHVWYSFVTPGREWALWGFLSSVFATFSSFIYSFFAAGIRFWKGWSRSFGTTRFWCFYLGSIGELLQWESSLHPRPQVMLVCYISIRCLICAVTSAIKELKGNDSWSKLHESIKFCEGFVVLNQHRINLLVLNHVKDIFHHQSKKPRSLYSVFEALYRRRNNLIRKYFTISVRTAVLLLAIHPLTSETNVKDLNSVQVAISWAKYSMFWACFYLTSSCSTRTSTSPFLLLARVPPRTSDILTQAFRAMVQTCDPSDSRAEW